MNVLYVHLHVHFINWVLLSDNMRKDSNDRHTKEVTKECVWYAEKESGGGRAHSLI